MPSVIASAPAHINLFGDPRGYRGGFTLPTPVSRRTRVVLDRRPGDQVAVYSRSRAEHACFALGAERRGDTWLDHVQGCTAALRGAGFALGGMALTIDSDVPAGGGLSAAAALEVAVLRAIRAAFALGLDDLTLALLAQRAAHELVATPVAMIDQLVASVGTPGHALLIDVRALQWRSAAAPAVDVVVVSAGLERPSAGAIVRRRDECEAAARALGVGSLHDLGLDDLPRMAALPPPLDRRARHVVTENRRALAAMRAIERRDVVTLGELVTASHASLRDDLEVSRPTVDALVDRALGDRDVLGARMLGGPAGGSVVVLADRGTGAEVGARLAATGGDGPPTALVLVEPLL